MNRFNRQARAGPIDLAVFVLLEPTCEVVGLTDIERIIRTLQDIDAELSGRRARRRQVGGIGQHLPADKGVDAAVFQQRHLLGVPQLGVGLVADDGRFAVQSDLEPAPQRVGLDLAGPVDLGDDGGRGLVAPAHGLEEPLAVGGRELDPRRPEYGRHPVTEDVVVREEPVPQLATQPGGGLDQAAVAGPGLGVEQPLALVFGQALLLALVRPVRQVRRHGAGHSVEIPEQVVAELLVERGAQVLVAGGEAQGRDGLAGEPAVQP